MADLLAHRRLDEGMSFGGRVVSAINQWVPLLRQTATTTSNEEARKASWQQRQEQQQQQQQQR